MAPDYVTEWLASPNVAFIQVVYACGWWWFVLGSVELLFHVYVAISTNKSASEHGAAPGSEVEIIFEMDLAFAFPPSMAYQYAPNFDYPQIEQGLDFGGNHRIGDPLEPVAPARGASANGVNSEADMLSGIALRYKRQFEEVNQEYLLTLACQGRHEQRDGGSYVLLVWM